ncbi:uncharacterized protein LOC134436794 [Engraulis encrasicolus]|uniref:uncharacterized protein LOC134436794 n=1 Tax=Engraulis encrasicolus TaxID=184585 RepID=UPI002FD3746E
MDQLHSDVVAESLAAEGENAAAECMENILRILDQQDADMATENLAADSVDDVQKSLHGPSTSSTLEYQQRTDEDTKNAAAECMEDILRFFAAECMEDILRYFDERDADKGPKGILRMSRIVTNHKKSARFDMKNLTKTRIFRKEWYEDLEPDYSHQFYGRWFRKKRRLVKWDSENLVTTKLFTEDSDEEDSEEEDSGEFFISKAVVHDAPQLETKKEKFSKRWFRKKPRLVKWDSENLVHSKKLFTEDSEEEDSEEEDISEAVVHDAPQLETKKEKFSKRWFRKKPRLVKWDSENLVHSKKLFTEDSEEEDSEEVDISEAVVQDAPRLETTEGCASDGIQTGSDIISASDVMESAAFGQDAALPETAAAGCSSEFDQKKPKKAKGKFWKRSKKEKRKETKKEEEESEKIEIGVEENTRRQRRRRWYHFLTLGCGASSAIAD